MWLRPARTVLTLASLLLLACGGRSPETDPDGGTTGAGGTSGAGGTMGTGGSGGAAGKGDGGQAYFANARGSKLTKLDLLFMIDNSSSMADKQQVLSMAIPELVDRLIDPKCV